MGAAVPHQVELDVAAAAMGLPGAVGFGVGLVAVPLDDGQVGVEKAVRDRLGEGKAFVEGAAEGVRGVEVVVEEASEAAALVAVLQGEVVVDQQIDNDASLPKLAEMSVALARAGVDFVCPSDMMDGRVGVIRRALDEASFKDVGIVAYSIKMASAFYGPFRAAANSAPAFGDRASYQMPASNRREALRELQLDVDEGADLLLIKPALSNRDLIRDARETTQHPLVAYQVSGEFAMVRAAADAGLLDFERTMTEMLTSIRRAGADLINSYDTRRRGGL